MPRAACLTLPALVLLAAGCATEGARPFWDGLRVIKSDQVFFHGRYIGTESGCFPPITNRLCVPLRQGEELYLAERHLEMESFSLSMSSDFFGQAEIKEKLYFAAAELGISRGFPMFTVTNTFDSTACRGSIESYTRGELTASPSGQGSNYAGSTTVLPSGQCLIGQGIKVIFFKRKEDLAAGVLARSSSAQGQWLYPEMSLYLGSTPNLRHADFNYQPLPGSFTQTPQNAWKVHYDAAGLSRDFRRKFNLPSPPLFTLHDEASETAAREAQDPLSRNRVITP